MVWWVVNEPGAAYLISRAGAKLLALALADVIEVMRPLPVSSLDGAPAFVLGAAVVRGGLVPVIDARALLGEPGRSHAASRWISLRLGARRAVLAVDGLLGTRRLGEAALQGVPPLLRGAAAGVAEAVGALDQDLLLVLGAGRLVPEAIWHSLERGARR